MPIIRMKEIVAMTPQEREQKLIDLRVELARIRTMVNAGGAVENPTRIRLLRKTIAKILTVENEQKIGLRKAPEPKKEEKPAKKAKPKKEAKQKEESKEKAPE
jgi:large subunit ribosomal protein L29